MWGSGPDSIYAVGDEGLMYWNGMEWKRMISPTKSVAATGYRTLHHQLHILGLGGRRYFLVCAKICAVIK